MRWASTILLLACGFILDPSTCQSQGESQEALWNTVQQSQRNHDGGAFQEPTLSLQQEQQHSGNVEYYDNEYYDDEVSVSELSQEGTREPKVIRPDEELPRKVNSTLYEDSYYYDDDYEEEEALPAAVVEPVNATEILQQPEIKPSQKSSKVTSKKRDEKEIVNEDKIEELEEEKKLRKGSEGGIDQISSYRNDTQGEEIVADLPTKHGPIFIGEAIVSVVTTKSVVNGTYSLPETTNPTLTSTFNTERVDFASNVTSTTSTTTRATTTANTSATTATTTTDEKMSTTPVFTASSTIQAAVQTGRSVSGARFLPFLTVDKIEQLDCTESIIDKLDRVQSELSSGFLVNGRFVPRRYNKKPFSVTSLTIPTTSTAAPTSFPIPPITITSITKRPRVYTTIDDVGAFLPKDFSRSYYRTSTTVSPLTKRPIIQTTLDDVEAFLPKDFPKSSHRTSTQSNNTTKRPKLQTTLDDLDGFLPKDYPKNSYRSPFKRPSHKTTVSATSVASSTEKSSASTRRKALTTIEDISVFLPPGYKLKKEDAFTEKPSNLSEISGKNKIVDLKEESITLTPISQQNKSIQDLFVKSSVDISALLPPGYKPDSANVGDSLKIRDGVDDLLSKSKVDISALLPPGFEADRDTGRESSPIGMKGVTGVSGNSFKVVFPSRPGGRKSISKITTPINNRGGDAVTPRIQKGWPTRMTTEFTGWPTSSTTPISIEKLLEAARTATISSANSSLPSTISEISSTPSTTTTTTTTLRPTTPGVCEEDCEVAGTIKIVENATWLPELLDRNTKEWQDLAEEVEREMNLVFVKSPILRKWVRNIRIDSFSQGSVLVDYFIELVDLKEKLNTQQLKNIFHDSLRTFNFNDPMEPRYKETATLGKFTIDPKFTEFLVIPRVAAPKLTEDENRLIPQWAIAVIVIGVGGLLFIIVFGVSVLVNRQHGSKLKPSITTIYEEEVSKNVISHATSSNRPVSEYQKSEDQTMWNDIGWHDKPFESTSHKILVDGLPYERKYNMYDSWKSEWNGYYYPPMQTSSSKSSRHHPDYDINF